MLSQREVSKICADTLTKLNLSGGYRQFVSHLHSGGTDTPTRELEAIIRLSIEKCVYNVLKEYDSRNR